MKKYICLILTLATIISVLVGCATPTTPADTTASLSETEESSVTTSNTVETTEEETTEATTTETTVPTPDKKPSNGTANPSPKPTTTQTSTNTGTQNDTNVLAGGKWDYGPVTWKVTKDGVLTISGPTYIQASDSYIWKIMPT